MIAIKGEITITLKKVVLTNITLCGTPRTTRLFVRYHWSGIPTSIDARPYRWKVSGNVSTFLELSLAELK